MTILQAIVYGIIQGLTEFLPISSTAHLIFIPKLLGWPDMGTAFDVALHLGTLVAVIAFFYKDWIKLISAGLTRPGSKNGKLFWYIVIACIPGGIVGVLFDNKVETIFRKNLIIIAVMMIVMGIVLYMADKWGSNNDDAEDIGLGRSLIIGISQALAVIPGVSRSGITMSAGLFAGLNKEEAARFSFLLSTPIVFGAGVFKLKDLFEHPVASVPAFSVAVITSAIVGFLCIKFLLDYLRKRDYKVFVGYRIIVGIALIIAVKFFM